ncbi:hypothetical protein COLO4_29491 [Corchorus olitorius]|uniref:F-box domain-containing protein n=1 Tax=Corchorus olitorius TaxID=93759 RepID=A0A1R3HED7_9ROSI|nr:hypothetical protein COLO4_29491 [Corchorus olitorius]
MGTRRIDLEKLCKESAVSSTQGWLAGQILIKSCLSRKKKKKQTKYRYLCSLQNINTSEDKILLPILPRDFTYCTKHLITAPPHTDQPCYVFSFVANRPILFYWRPGDKNWTSLIYAENQHQGIHDAINCDGKLYVLYDNTELCEIVFTDSGEASLRRYGWTWILPPRSSLFYEYRLVESDGEVFAVGTKSIFDINVFKMDSDVNLWCKVSMLNAGTSFAFYTNLSASFSASQLRVKENSIFFTEPEFSIENDIVVSNHKDDNDDPCLFSFNLLDMSLSLWSRTKHALGTPQHQMAMYLMRCRFPEKSKGRTTKYKGGQIRFIQASYKDRYYNRDIVESRILNIPEDVRSYIFQRLTSVYDWINFRAMCKEWRSLVHPIQWTPNHSHLPFEYPWLMYPHEKRRGMYNFYDPVGNFMHSICIPQLDHCKVCFSHKGWLLVTKLPTSIFFLEPFTSTIIPLPNLMEDCWFDAFCFSGAPTSMDWQIFAISYSIPESFFITCHLRSGQGHWSVQFMHCTAISHPCFSNLVFDGQYFCYLGNNGNVVCFNEHNLQHPIVKGSSSKAFMSNYWRRFLVCSGDEMLSVWIHKFRDSLHVFKLNSQGDKWVEIESVDKKSLYVSQTASLAVEAKTPRMRDTVQLCMFSEIHGHDKNKNISFSLKDQTSISTMALRDIHH